MNKRIKGLIAFSVALGTIGSINGFNTSGIFTKEAYASTDEADEITGIELEDSDGDSIDIYEDDDYEDELEDDPEVGQTYYAESSSKNICINIDGADEDYVRIFKGTTEYEVGDNIKLTSGINTFKIRVYEEEYDEDEEYSSSDYNQYTLKVDYDEEDEEDEPMLSDISLSDANIDFDNDYTSYDLDVDNSVKSIDIQAIPENDDFTVKINGSTVDEEDDYKKNITLDVGINDIKIKVLNDDDYETYTLYINRLDEVKLSETTTSNTINNSQNSVEIRNPISIEGWKLENDIWYYLDSNGNKMTGWRYVNNIWYYLNNDGKMLTGWFKDVDEKWYYLQSSGAMAKNTTIDGYKLGQDGAWIK